MSKQIVIARKFKSPQAMMDELTFIRDMGMNFGTTGQPRFTTLGELRDYLEKDL